MEEKTIYFVKLWINPEASERFFDWLNTSHFADVVALPGFLWGRMIALEASNEDGWPAYMMMYGVESREALEAYFKSDAPAGFAKERQELDLDEHLRFERDIGAPAKFLQSR